MSFDLAYYVFFDSSHWSIGYLYSIQFSLFPAHNNISYNNNNVYILCRKGGGQKTMLKWILFTILCGHSILAADDESVVVSGRDVMSWHVARLFTKQS